MGKLSAATVRSLKHPSNSGRPVRFGDGGGLYLQVAAGNTKSWLFRYTLRGKAHEMGLGPVGEPPDGVPLAKARTLAAEAAARLRAGRDPIEERRADRTAQRQAEAGGGGQGAHVQGCGDVAGGEQAPGLAQRRSTAPSGSRRLRRTPSR